MDEIWFDFRRVFRSLSQIFMDMMICWSKCRNQRKNERNEE